MMLSYFLRRMVLTIPTLLAISLAVFLLVDLAPGSPLSQIPLTIPPEIRQNIMTSLGADQPVFLRYLLWIKQFFWVEPLVLFDQVFGSDFASGQQRILSWQSRSPVMMIIAERLPQTLLVIGGGYLLGVLMALPLAILSAARPGSWLDRLASGISMIGFSVPSYFLGLGLILIFAVKLQWLPSVYDTELRVNDWQSLQQQARQMAMPVLVLALYNAAEISRYLRGAMIEQLQLDYVRAAHARGIAAKAVLLRHVLRNSLLPVISVIALGVPTIFAGAIITEQLFRINGLGSLLIGAIQAGDLPMAQSLLFIFAVLIVLFNLLADFAYQLLDPRIRYA